MSGRVLGVIGGSGVYDFQGLRDAAWRRVESPWGRPSDAILTGTLNGQPLAFLPRHGRGHRLSPSDIDYRANIDALKRLGVTDLVSVSAVGSLREDLPPGRFVLVDQFIDRTFARDRSFFGAGCVGHVAFARPVSPWLVDLVEAACRDLGVGYRRGGTYVAMEGPQFSTRAESELHRHWGASVIGMTAMPEAKLAREAELRYATVAMVTDFDGWHREHEAVTVGQVVAAARANARRVRGLIDAVAAHLKDPPRDPDCGSDRALDGAIMTAPEARDPALLAKLDAVAGRVL